MDHDLKTCEYCKKEIAKIAVKCPFCQEWQTKRELSFRNPYIKGLIGAVVFLLALTVLPKLIFFKTIQRYSYDPKTYSKNNSKVFITKHSLIKRKNSFVIVGEIDNKESIKWASMTVLATFKDKNGALTSLGSGYIHNLGPNSSKPFEVSIGCSDEPYDSEKYASYEIEIDEGREDFRMPK